MLLLAGSKVSGVKPVGSSHRFMVMVTLPSALGTTEGDTADVELRQSQTVALGLRGRVQVALFRLERSARCEGGVWRHRDGEDGGIPFVLPSRGT